jgi:putative inorganic carbon (HCO3(-)) transporter
MNLFVLLLILFVYVVRPGEWIPGLDIRWNMILNGIGLITLIAFAGSKDAKAVVDKTWAYLIGFYLLMLVSSITHAQFSDIAAYTPQMLTNMLVFMLILSSVRNTRSLAILTVFILGLTVFIIFQCHLQVTTGTNVAGTTPFFRGVDGPEGHSTTLQPRWVGVFHDPNDLGLFFVAFVPLTAAKTFFLPASAASRLFWAVSTAVLIYGVILTNSRGTFLALMAALGFFFLLKYRSVRGIIAAVAGGMLLLTLGPSRMSSVTSADDSAMERIYMWIEAMYAFATNPFFGLGPMHWYDWHHRTTHNSYVLAFVENGIFAYTCWLAIFIIPLYITSAAAFTQEDKRQRIEAAALGGCLAGVMMSLFFISRTYVLIPYMITAYVLAHIRVTQPAAHARFLPKVKLVHPAVIAAGSIIIVWVTNILTTRLML